MKSSRTHFLRRLVRFAEIWRLFGPASPDTWRTLFPPFKGWDVGCGYCRNEKQALGKRYCRRGELKNYRGCGVL